MSEVTHLSFKMNEQLRIAGEVIAAQDRIGNYIRETPLEYSAPLSELCGCEVHLKLENWQVTGSFKVRGALNKILPLGSSNKTVVTASTGNHAVAVAYALQEVGMNGVIFLPENVSKSKAAKLKYYSCVKLEYYGDDSVLTEKRAKEYALEHDLEYISPYDDPKIIAGQGTIGKELLDGSLAIDSILVPVGGGGLISGIAGYCKEEKPELEIVGCQPENSAVMYKSVIEGRLLDIPSLPTISDGTAGGVDQGSITFDFCKELVDKWIIVSEDEIRNALSLILENHQMMVEGAAGLALASLLKEKENFAGKSVVLIICGNKFSPELLSSIVCG